MERTPVGIVGAGPAGLVLAHLLQRAAIPFVLWERSDRSVVGGRPKAGEIEYRTVRLLEEHGISGSVIEFTVRNGRCEFRTPDSSVVLDYGALTGGRTHFIYPQHELVQHLCDALVDTGADVRCRCSVTGLRQRTDEVVLSIDGPDGGESQIACDVVVGCDGSRSVIAQAIGPVHVAEESLPARLLAIIGAAGPLETHAIYAAHPNGFAGQLRRGPAQTRYYLEIPATDRADQWPTSRVRDELDERLVARGQLDDVELSDMSFVDLRVRVRTPMQHGGVFLAGDSAHLITPAGGKGMNLGIQDAVELAQGLIDRFGPRRSEDRLTAYSHTRLPPIWRAQSFSNWFLRLILAGLGEGTKPRSFAHGNFAGGLREGWIDALQHDQLLATWFAHAYAGVDP
jgi:p-hydroxybenzoate 3-monooxygenase